MPYWGKTTGEYEIFSGVLAGILVLGGLFVWIIPGLFTPFAGPILIVFGFLCFCDDCFPYGKQPFLFSEGGGVIAGCIFAGISLIYGFLVPVLLLAALLSILKLILKYVIKIGRERPNTFKP